MALMPRDDFSQMIYAEQVRVVFRQMPKAVAVNLVNGPLTALVLAPVTIRWHLLTWLGLLIAATTARGALWWCYRTARTQDSAAPRWAALGASCAALSGLCWGSGGAVLLPVAVFEQMFLVLVIGGMCIGTLGMSAAHLPTLFAFLLPACLPIAARFLLEGALPNLAMAGMILVFLAALSLVGIDFHRSIAKTLRLGFELAARTCELDEAEARLRAEIALHRSTEAELRQAQKLEVLGQLTGGIAHDFNNLMTAVIGNLELALRQANGRVVPLLGSALRAAERGAALTQRLLAFGRKQHLDPRPVDLASLVHGVEDMLRRTLGPSIRTVITSDADLAPAFVDANQLELAIVNLAINSRDAMPEGGVLRIRLENREGDGAAPRELRPGSYVVLSISDSGTGMNEVTLARAVEPFFTTKEVGRGSGLGLAMVHGFTGQSGGTIAIRSRLGEGTTVELWLPRADATSARGAPASDDRGPRRPALEEPHGGQRILLCDDDPEVRDFMTGFLRDQGYAVRAVTSPTETLRIIASGTPIDLFIVDYAMPEMNGLELLRAARGIRPGLAGLLVSGHAEASAGDVGDGDPLLLKPFKLTDLARIVADILAKRAA
ncbi:MAG: response regulator [Alphaproteobacteria bacterium]|nr:response regulator [Alphaproteobacteria bacterium]